MQCTITCLQQRLDLQHFDVRLDLQHFDVRLDLQHFDADFQYVQ